LAESLLAALPLPRLSLTVQVSDVAARVWTRLIAAGLDLMCPNPKRGSRGR